MCPSSSRNGAIGWAVGRCPLLSEPPESSGEAAAPATAGSALARDALDRARAQARRSGVAASRKSVRRRGTGAGRDDRDPQPFGVAVAALLAERGWEQTARSAAVMGRWDSLVGPELAEHCRPVSLRDGELVLVAESTAWATQVRLLGRQLIVRLNRQLGAGVIRQVRVHGPTAPSWVKGPRRVAGRGPRDTYG